jgi:hypothetical protein
LGINRRTEPIASMSIVTNVKPIIGKFWSKGLNKKKKGLIVYNLKKNAMKFLTAVDWK